MDLQPPAKRARNEENPPQDRGRTLDSSFPPFSRSPTEVWFEDGNIIIVCGTTGFRVHKGVLALNSTVFRDMFAVGNPSADCNETFEGCVVVRLPDDATDMLRLLKALYLRDYARRGDPIDFETLRSLFKLSTKYAFDKLRTEYVEHIKPMFPTMLCQYKGEPSVEFYPDDFDPAIVVELGVTYQIPSIVPLACYHTALLPIEALLDGPSAAVHNGKPRELSRAAERMCLIFREKLAKIIAESLRTAEMLALQRTPWWPNDMPGARCSAKCEGINDRARQTIEQAYRALEADIFRIHCPGASISMDILRDAGVRSPCSNCQKRLERFEADIACQIWYSLPMACGYKDWDAVHKAQTMASNV